jgi:poly-gamma-glutamate capsule biosynthesis protein CapA/YwtB (metallophosphatase superfamily)
MVKNLYIVTMKAIFFIIWYLISQPFFQENAMRPLSITWKNFSTALCINILSLLVSASHSYAGQIIINAVGDIMLAGKGAKIYARRGYDYPFAAIARELRNGDITIGNLEAPITSQGTEFIGKKFRFRSDPATADALRRAGFTVLALANNHIMDYGRVGLKETLMLLDKAGILHSGAGENLDLSRKPAVVHVGKKEIAFLSYSLTFPAEFYARNNRAGTAPGVSIFFKKDIASAKTKYDYVIVSFHWGTENTSTPSQYQIAAAHAAIDSGADVVIGHHPHVLQGIERYGSGIVFYSMGNFAFGCMNLGPSMSAIARISLDREKKEAEIFPLNVSNSEIFFQPRIVTGKRGLKIINQLNVLSKPFGTRIYSKGTRYFLCDKINKWKSN